MEEIKSNCQQHFLNASIVGFFLATIYIQWSAQLCLPFGAKFNSQCYHSAFPADLIYCYLFFPSLAHLTFPQLRWTKILVQYAFVVFTSLMMLIYFNQLEFFSQWLCACMLSSVFILLSNKSY
jgi:hypothetical protein